MSLSVQFNPSLRTTPLLHSLKTPVVAPQVAALRFGTSVAMNTTYFSAEANTPLLLAPAQVVQETASSIHGAVSQLVNNFANVLGGAATASQAKPTPSPSLSSGETFFETASPTSPFLLSRMPSNTRTTPLNLMA